MRTLSRSGEAAGRRRARGPYTERSAAPEISRSGGEPTGPLGSFDVFSLIVNKMIGTGSMQLQGGSSPIRMFPEEKKRVFLPGFVALPRHAPSEQDNN